MAVPVMHGLAAESDGGQHWWLKLVSPPAMARQIELWPVERLVPYARNARTHSDDQIAQIAASIVEFGFNNPVLVDSNAGIIAGHGRLLAARKLRLEHVPVVVLDHLTETQKRAYILADNRISENAGWDEDTLAAELGELASRGLAARSAGFLRGGTGQAPGRCRTCGSGSFRG